MLQKNQIYTTMSHSVQFKTAKHNLEHASFQKIMKESFIAVQTCSFICIHICIHIYLFLFNFPQDFKVIE